MNPGDDLSTPGSMVLEYSGANMSSKGPLFEPIFGAKYGAPWETHYRAYTA